MKYLITFVGLIVFNLNCLNAQIFVKSDATGINDGTSWTNAYTNLSVAIQTAQAGDQIWVAAGTYLPGDTLSATFSINKNLEIYGGFAGTETILSQRDDSTNLTILSGDINGDDIPEDLIKNKGDNARTIITFQATITNATILDGFTIMRGHADTSAAPFTYAGGGIVSLGHPIIRSCTFTENFARNYGGAIYFGNAGASGAKVEFCKFFLNGSEFGGGGISFNDVNGFNTESLVKDCQFERNYAGSSGGGIRISNSEVEIYSCSFNNNSANFLGGGVMIYQTINNESVSVENCTFKSNESTLGAGLYAEPEAANFLLNVRDCQFIGNIVSPIRAGYDPNGGGMMIFYDGPSNSGTTNVSNCLFKENVAEKIGGGLKVSFLGPNSSVNVDSCIFLENIITPTVLAGGAGIQAGVFNTNSSLQITNSDFLANTGGSAGSLLFETLNGGELDALVSHCNFLENKTTEGGPGIVIVGYQSGLAANHIIEYCRFEKNGFVPSAGKTYGGGIGITGGLANFKNTVRYCEFVDNENLKGGAAIEVAEVVAVPTLGFSEFIELNVQNCLFAQHDSGQTVILTEKTTENILTNNTFADNEMPALNVKNSGILQLRNNIIQSPNHPDIEFETNGTITSLGGNLISDSSASQYLQVSDMEGADPEFKGEGEHPYQIHFTSPAVDLGVFYQGFDPNRPDLAGNPRFQGIVVDAGAYESPFTTTIKDFREENDALNMYPVPLKTIATLTLTNNWKGEMTLKVFDTKGQQVLLEKLTKNLYQAEWEVDFGQLPRGNYHLLLSDGNHAITKAFVKM